MILIKNLDILNEIENYINFNDKKLIEYLSNLLVIQKERLIIKNINIEELSYNKINIADDECIILINDNDYDCSINYIRDSSHEIYNCFSNSSLIINKVSSIDLSYKSKIKYIIVQDICKSNKIINNPKQLFENYETVNERKNNIFTLNDENIINDDDCDFFIKLLNTYIENKEYNIEKWGNGSNVNCLFMHVENIKNVEVKKKVDNKIFQIVNKVINYLYKEYDIVCKGDSGYCLRKIYGCTREHKDGVLSKTNDKSKSVYKNQIRNMSIIIALNSDYENGEFYFPMQNFKIKLKKGEIIVFPPYWTHPHFVREPTNNTYRYTINTWLYE